MAKQAAGPKHVGRKRVPKRVPKSAASQDPLREYKPDKGFETFSSIATGLGILVAGTVIMSSIDLHQRDARPSSYSRGSVQRVETQNASQLGQRAAQPEMQSPDPQNVSTGTNSRSEGNSRNFLGVLADYYTGYRAWSAANGISDFFKNERNPMARSHYLRELSRDIGTGNALRAFMMYQAPEDFVMPTGSEYLDYLREYSREAGINAMSYADDPEAFQQIILGHTMDPLFLDPSNPASYVVVSLRSFRRTLGDGDFDRHVQRWDRAQDHSGFIAAYKNMTGQYPRTPEELEQARMGVVWEHQVPENRSPDYTIYRRSESPSGTVETWQYNPTAPDGGRGNYEAYQREQQRAGAAQRLDQYSAAGAERMRQMGNQGVNQLGQGAERGRQMINQLFKPRDPNKQ